MHNVPEPTELLDRILHGTDRHLVSQPECVLPSQIVKQVIADCERPSEFTERFRKSLSHTLFSRWDPSATTYYEAYVYLELLATFPKATALEQVLEILFLLGKPDSILRTCPPDLPTQPALDRLAVACLKAIYATESTPYQKAFRQCLLDVLSCQTYTLQARSLACAEWIADNPAVYLTLPVFQDYKDPKVIRAFKIAFWQHVKVAPLLADLSAQRYQEMSIDQVLKHIARDPESPADIMLRMQETTLG